MKKHPSSTILFLLPIESFLMSKAEQLLIFNADSALISMIKAKTLMERCKQFKSSMINQIKRKLNLKKESNLFLQK